MGMQALYVGLSGIQTSSNALNTTANNLTNVNTEGYVRQQVVYKDQGYNLISTTAANTTGQKGLGVTISTVNHVRDVFLDAAYRKEYGRQTFYDNMYDSIYEIETHMGELDGEPYQNTIKNLLSSLNEVSDTPTDQTAVSGLTQDAVAFVKRSQSIYSGLKNYQKTLNEHIKTTVNRINEIGSNIVDLNRRISRIETGGYENAADLRDQRDLLLDELASYCKITYDEDMTGSVSVCVEGVQFADNLSYNKIDLEQIPGTELVNPVWSQFNGQSVYNMNVSISTDKNTDIGGLKGLLAARGSCTPTYLSMIKPDAANYAGGETDSNYLMALNEYNLYQTSAKTSTLVNTMANFDKLVNTMVESINNILCPETTYEAADGTVYTVLDTDKASTSGDGTYGEELFTRNYCSRYTETTIDGQTFYVRNNVNTFNNVSAYTIENISVNDDILQDYSKWPLHRENGEEDYDMAKALVDLFSKDTLTYNGGSDGLTFEEFYETLTLDIGNTGSIYKSMSENEATLAHSLDGERQEVMSVSSDEELTSMIKYQQAYNASSRYINVVSSMIESLINMMGA